MSSFSSSITKNQINQWLQEIFPLGQTSAELGAKFHRRLGKFNLTFTFEILHDGKLKISIQNKVPYTNIPKDPLSAHFLHLKALCASKSDEVIVGKCGLCSSGFITEEFEFDLPKTLQELKIMLKKSWEVFESALKRLELELAKPYPITENRSPSNTKVERAHSPLPSMTSVSSLPSPLSCGGTASSSIDSGKFSSTSPVTTKTLNLRHRLQTNLLNVSSHGRNHDKIENCLFQGDYDQRRVNIHKVILLPTEQEKAFTMLDNLIHISRSQIENVSLIEILGYIVGDITGSNFSVASSISTNTITIRPSQSITLLIVSEVPVLSYSWYEWWLKIRNFDIVFHEYNIVRTCKQLLDTLIVLQNDPICLQFPKISPLDIYLSQDQQRVTVDILPIFLSSLSSYNSTTPLTGHSFGQDDPTLQEELAHLSVLFTPHRDFGGHPIVFCMGAILLMLFFSESVTHLASAPVFNKRNSHVEIEQQMFLFYQDPPLPLSPIVFDDIKMLIDLTILCPNVGCERVAQLCQELLQKLDAALPRQFHIQDFDHDLRGEHPIKRIGTGGQSNVFRAFLLPQQEWVALKVAKIDDTLPTLPAVMKSLLYEVHVHSELQHDNIVRLYGVLGANVQLCSLRSSHITTPSPQASTLLSSLRSPPGSEHLRGSNNNDSVSMSTASANAAAATADNNVGIDNDCNGETTPKPDLATAEQFTMIDSNVSSLKSSLKSSLITPMGSDASIKSTDAFFGTSRVPHPNTINDSFLQPPTTNSTYGIEDASHRLVLVTEYCPYGDLHKMLQHYHHMKNRARFNSEFLPILLSILYDVACGMDYLHAQKILHRDLKPQNVFLTKDTSVSRTCFVAKLGDLGIAKRLTKPSLSTDPSNHDEPQSSFINTKDNGSLLYIAPETIVKNKCTRRSDVFSFAMLMHDCLVTLQLKHKYEYGFEKVAGYDPHKFEIAFKNYWRIKTNWIPKFDLDPDSPWFTLPLSIKEPLQALMKQCFEKEPKKRPLFGEIKTKLAQLKAQL